MSEKLNSAPSVNNLSREPTAHQANKQTFSEKKTKGYSSGKYVVSNCDDPYNFKERQEQYKLNSALMSAM